MAKTMHKKPISSLSRLFSVGVRKRTRFSSAWLPLAALSAAADLWGRRSVREHSNSVVSRVKTRRCCALLEERPNHSKEGLQHKSLGRECFQDSTERRLLHPGHDPEARGGADKPR